jgi:hypothetical protein
VEISKFKVAFTIHELLAILPTEAALHFCSHNIKQHGNLKKVYSKNYRPHSIIVMRLLHCELASPSTWTNKVLLSEEHEEYASA